MLTNTQKIMTGLGEKAGETVRPGPLQVFALMKTVLDHVQESAFLIDEDARLRYVNQAACQCLGYSQAELLELNLTEIDAGVSLAIWRDRWAESKARGRQQFEARHRTKDGRLIPVEINSSHFEVAGQDCHLALVRDITDRKRSEEALQESEALQRQLLENLPMGVFIVDPATRLIESVNDQAANHFGAPKERIVGRRCHAFLCPAAEHACPVCDLGKVVDNAERELIRADGSTMPILKSVKKIRIGGQEKLLECFLDITERKATDEALRASARRLQLATAAGRMGVWDLDLASGELIWDDQMFELYGLSRDACNPSHEYWLRNVLHPEDRPAVEDSVRAALAGEAPLYLEFRARIPDGSTRYFKSHAMVLRDPEGRPIRMIGIIRDRTEQEEAERERRRLQAELYQAEKLESIGSLASGVAHDMNNVLAGILIAAELLRQSFPDGDPVARSLDHILHAGARGRDLVQALTAYARKGLQEPSPVDLNGLLEREVELLRHTTLQRIKVVMDLEPALPWIMGNDSALSSAVMNLAVNAVDAMPKGGTLGFRTRLLGNGIAELEVTDTGLGMPPEVLAKATEPYFTTKPIGKGTGLGLARVFGTVAAHGGSLEIRSAPDHGTAVVLRLPTLPPASRRPEPPARALPGQPQRRIEILLVDDDPSILETVPPLLSFLGHQVRTAATGEEALALLESGQEPGLVILDHHMPGLTGLETLVRLRKGHPRLPVIMTTGLLEPATAELLADIPWVRILMKPYSLEAMKQHLAASL